MADESSRIKDIDVEASSIAADDFVVIDGATNGSRKLKAMKLAESKNIAPEFSASSGYDFGSLVLKDGVLYRAKELLSAGAWDSTKWESIDVDGAIPNVNHLLTKDDGTQVVSQTNYLIAQDNETTGTSLIVFSKDASSVTNDEAVMYGMGKSAVVAANAGKVLAVNADGTDVELITPASTFTATYNSTKFADIASAVSAGKCVKCYMSGYTYELVQALSNKITFALTNNVNGTIAQETIWVNSDDTWDGESVNVAGKAYVDGLVGDVETLLAEI